MALRQLALPLLLCMALARGQEVFGYDYGNATGLREGGAPLASAGDVAVAVCAGVLVIAIVGLLVFFIIRKYLVITR